MNTKEYWVNVYKRRSFVHLDGVNQMVQHKGYDVHINKANAIRAEELRKKSKSGAVLVARIRMNLDVLCVEGRYDE